MLVTDLKRPPDLSFDGIQRWSIQKCCGADVERTRVCSGLVQGIRIDPVS